MRPAREDPLAFLGLVKIGSDGVNAIDRAKNRRDGRQRVEVKQCLQMEHGPKYSRGAGYPTHSRFLRMCAFATI